MDRINCTGLVWIGLAIFICIGSIKLSLGTFTNPGPGFLSFSTGIILGVLAILLQIESQKLVPEKLAEPFWTYGKSGLKRIVITIVNLLAYAVGMQYLGFLVSTAVFITVHLIVIESKRWPVAIFFSFCISIVSYLIFVVWLDAQLPRGPFKFL